MKDFVPTCLLFRYGQIYRYARHGGDWNHAENIAPTGDQWHLPRWEGLEQSLPITWCLSFISVVGRNEWAKKRLEVVGQVSSGPWQEDTCRANQAETLEFTFELSMETVYSNFLKGDLIAQRWLIIWGWSTTVSKRLQLRRYLNPCLDITIEHTQIMIQLFLEYTYMYTFNLQIWFGIYVSFHLGKVYAFSVHTCLWFPRGDWQ